ncbi:MAG: four helix bundle protein [bacterium]|nr:four helix bundle protein [bacterium]
MEQEKTTIKDFTDLRVWQEGHELVLIIYKFTKSFPKEETYSLVDQMRRAASSITANIAEGFGRHGYKDKINFYYHALGSLTELRDQLLIARDVGYLKNEDFTISINKADNVNRLLHGFIAKSKTFLNKNS